MGARQPPPVFCAVEANYRGLNHNGDLSGVSLNSSVWVKCRFCHDLKCRGQFGFSGFRIVI